MILLLAYALLAAWTARQLRTAPHGVELEDGFHALPARPRPLSHRKQKRPDFVKSRGDKNKNLIRK